MSASLIDYLIASLIIQIKNSLKPFSISFVVNYESRVRKIKTNGKLKLITVNVPISNDVIVHRTILGISGDITGRIAGTSEI